MPASLPTRASAFVFLCAFFAVGPAHAQTERQPPAMSAPLSPPQRAHLWLRASVDPAAWFMPGLDAAFSMAHPPRQQPPAWSVGAEGFAHLYAGYLARQSAATMAQAAVAALLHEDTRYQPAAQGNPLRRAARAVSFTVVDRRASGRSPSGRRAIAVSSFAAAFTAAALANTWVAPQFQNSTHLAQRTLTSLAALSGSTLTAEFRPDAIRITHRLAHRTRQRIAKRPRAVSSSRTGRTEACTSIRAQNRQIESSLLNNRMSMGISSIYPPARRSRRAWRTR